MPKIVYLIENVKKLAIAVTCCYMLSSVCIIIRIMITTFLNQFHIVFAGAETDSDSDIEIIETNVGRNDLKISKYLEEDELMGGSGNVAKGAEICSKQTETPLQEKPKERIRLSEAEILRTFEDWVFKYQQRKSMKDVGGVNQVEMVTEAIRFMLEAIGIEMSRAPFSIEPDGDCLYNTLAFIANPTLTKEESAEKGTATRQAVMEEAIEVISAMSSERLVPILAAAVSDKGKPVTREELLAMLDRYRQNGQWDSGLGDLGPQLCASFTRTPLFVIWIDLISKKTTGYFVNPAHVFNQPEHESVPRVVVRMNNHYEPLLLPAEATEALVAIYRHTQTQQMQMAAIQLPVRSIGEEDSGSCAGS